jgi:hypothetical protein
VTRRSLNRDGRRAEYTSEMTTAGRFDPSRATGALQVEHCDIPAEMTLADWRRECARSAAATRGDRRRTAVGRRVRRALRLA